MGVEKIEIVGIGLKTTGEKTDCNRNNPDFIADIRQQVIDLFYGEIRNFLTVLEPLRKKFNMSDPWAQALATVMDASAAGKIAGYVTFFL